MPPAFGLREKLRSYRFNWNESRFVEVFENEILKHKWITMESYFRAIVEAPMVVMVNLYNFEEKKN